MKRYWHKMVYMQMWNRQREVDEAGEKLRLARETDTEGFLSKQDEPEPAK